MVCLIKKLIENQLRMSFFPADVIFAQASSDAFEASKYVDSDQGLRLRETAPILSLYRTHLITEAWADSAFTCPTGN